jgi:phage/conjugal plasmid C-4 type zinc finger TraR family protein
MADIIDRAQAGELDFLEECLAAVRSMDDDDARGSLTHCEICGERITEARRQAVPGCRLCVVCQEELDRCP